MVKYVSTDRRFEAGKYLLEVRVDVDDKPYVIIRKYSHVEDADADAIKYQYCPELVVRKI